MIMTDEKYKENEKEFDDWNPDEAKIIGTLKGIVEIKSNADIVFDINNINFSEPKKKKKERTSAKVIDLKKKKNKGTLF